MAKKNNLTTRANYHASILKKEQDDKERLARLNEKRKEKEARKIARAAEMNVEDENEAKNVEGEMTVEADAKEEFLKRFLDRSIRKITEKPKVISKRDKMIKKKAEARERKIDNARINAMDIF